MYKGRLEGFPSEVVEKMLERQVEQGNKRDVTVFEENEYAEANVLGFDWVETIEGSSFWHEVIYSKNFDRFFEKYPKESLEEELKRLELRVEEIKKILNK